MNVCGRGECQTTAGCAHRGPKGELCVFPVKNALSFNGVLPVASAVAYGRQRNHAYPVFTHDREA